MSSFHRNAAGRLEKRCWAYVVLHTCQVRVDLAGKHSALVSIIANIDYVGQVNGAERQRIVYRRIVRAAQINFAEIRNESATTKVAHVCRRY